MAYNPSEDRFFATTTYGELLSVEPATGVPTHIATLPERAWGVAYDMINEALYGVTQWGPPTLWQIDVEDGTPTVIGQIDDSSAIEGLAFDPVRQHLLAVLISQPLSDSLLVTVDPQTAAPTPIGEIGSEDFISGLAYVPEPGSFYLILLGGLAGLLGRRR